MRIRSGLGGFIAAAILFGSLLLVAGCSSAPSSPPASPAAPGTPSSNEKPYGSLVIAGIFGAGTLDPASSTVGYQSLGGAIVDSLVYRLGAAEFKPGLAERWEVAPDGKTHTFFIRKGVKFHDGSDLAAADVKFSIDRIMAPDSKSASASLWRDAVTSVEIKDDYTVVLHLKEPQYELLQSIDTEISAVLPKKYIEEKGIDVWNKKPIGSGPWKVVNWELQNRLDLEAVDQHWRNVPKFKNITILNVLEDSTAVAMLKTGELDLAGVSSDSAAGIKSAGLHLITFPAASHYLGYMFYDVDHPETTPLGDKRVKKALALSLNRQEMADKLFGGYARPYVMTPVLMETPFLVASGLKPDPYDPEGAKKLLAEAGVPNGFDMRIIDTTGRGLTTINTAISGYFKRIGVNARLDPMEYAAWTAMRYPKNLPGTFNALWTWPITASTDFARVRMYYHSVKGSVRNTRNPALDANLDKVFTIADPAQRLKAAAEAVVMARDEYSNLPLLDVDLILGVSSKVGQITAATTQSQGTLAAIQFETITHAK
ncbi:MAG: ABC transporter substrate-binding protein [Chloroflexi bacterium]|nr:ABC transporter substrate-binding protein [Chloroflexota bacterium]